MPSSVIHGMLYSPEQEALLIVFVGDHDVYRYEGVSAAEWQAFRWAPSKGTYLNHVFKAKHPRVARLGQAAPLSADTATRKASPDLPDENVWGFYETSTL